MKQHIHKLWELGCGHFGGGHYLPQLFFKTFNKEGAKTVYDTLSDKKYNGRFFGRQREGLRRRENF